MSIARTREMANRDLPILEAIRSRRRRLARIGLSKDGAMAVLAIPEGLEDAPLGTWCPLCGRLAAGRDLLLTVLEVQARVGTTRRLVSVHPRCMRLESGS